MNNTGSDLELNQAVPGEQTEKIADEPRRCSRALKTQATGFARIAKTISSRATDLLAISIIAVAGLTMGGHLVDWWSTDTDQLAGPGRSGGTFGPTDTSWGLRGTPVNLQFADKPYSISRQVLSGDRKQALGILEQNCQAVLAEAGLSTFSETLGEITLAEQRLLDASAKIEPTRQKPGDWQLYQIEQPILMILGTRYQPQIGDPGLVGERLHRENAAAGQTGFTAANFNADGLVGPGRRVVCWGLALPTGEDSWTLFSYRTTPSSYISQTGSDTVSAGFTDPHAVNLGQIAVGGSAASTAGWPQIELPPKSHPVLSLCNKNGAFIVFKGDGHPDEWVEFYRTWFKRHGWQPAHRWKIFPQGRSARYYGTTGRADVQIRADTRRGLDGVLNVQFHTNQTTSPTKGDP